MTSKHLPEGFGMLTCLKRLIMRECEALEEFPSRQHKMTNYITSQCMATPTSEQNPLTYKYRHYTTRVTIHAMHGYSLMTNESCSCKWQEAFAFLFVYLIIYVATSLLKKIITRSYMLLVSFP